ncbi:MAG: 50S ribosomal protein L10 [Alphaproteobacteria bacterium]|nr:50S ribosomal protein L10 [Alphaproteobacteria bacterium]
MGISRAQKETEIQDMNARFENDELIVVTHYSGLTVKEMSELRAGLREAGACFKVTKNSLAKIAIKGTKFEAVSDLFTGPTGMASSQDSVAAAKGAYNFAKKNDNLIILGGALGNKVLDVAEIEQLAKLPSLDEIRSKLVGLLQAPATKMVGVLQAPARDLVGVTRAYGEKSE